MFKWCLNLRIGIVTTWFERGAAYVSKQLADSLLNQGYKISIYARGGERIEITTPPWSTYDLTVDRSPRLPMPTAICRKQFSRFIAEKKLDILIFNEQQYWQPVLWAKSLGCRVVAYVDYYTAETVPFFNVYDGLICNTKRHLGVFQSHPRAIYVPWGTDLNIFSLSSPKTARDELVFFHSAGFNPYRKGTDLLLRAFELLNDTPCQLIIHTQVDLKRYFPELLKTIASLLDDGKLRLIQKTVPAPGLYSCGDVYVYPSRLDGIGLTVVEALACGLPCIVPNEAPMNEFVDQQSGVRVSIDRRFPRSDAYYWSIAEVSVEQLAKAMRRYLIDKDFLKIQQNYIFNAASKRFDWSKNSESLGLELSNLTLTSPSQDLTKKIFDYDINKVPHYESLKSLYNVLFTQALKLWDFFR